jgi:hypothetical protein
MANNNKRLPPTPQQSPLANDGRAEQQQYFDLPLQLASLPTSIASCNPSTRGRLRSFFHNTGTTLCGDQSKQPSLRERILHHASLPVPAPPIELHPLQRGDKLQSYKAIVEQTARVAGVRKSELVSQGPVGGAGRRSEVDEWIAATAGSECSATSAGELARKRRSLARSATGRGRGERSPEELDIAIAEVYSQLKREHPDLFQASTPSHWGIHGEDGCASRDLEAVCVFCGLHKEKQLECIEEDWVCRECLVEAARQALINKRDLETGMEEQERGESAECF